MYFPDEKTFKKLTAKGNLIPVYKQIRADLDTPVSAFLKIRQGKYNFLLESVEGSQAIARYSFLGTQPALVLRSKGSFMEITDNQRHRFKRIRLKTDPLDEIKKVMSGYEPVHYGKLPRFCGGFVGYLGYDAVRFFEKIPDKNQDDLKVWDSVWILSDTLLVFDHLFRTISIVSNVYVPDRRKAAALYAKAKKKIERLNARLMKPLPAQKKRQATNEVKIRSNFKKQDYLALIKKAKAYIRKGDIIQVVPSQRFSLALGNKSALDVYSSLRSLNPSSYMFFLEFNDYFLLGSSPEVLVRCEEKRVITRPIAGTRARGTNAKEDQKLEKQLLGSRKEKAEHIMLVDLGRNDLGRVCQYATIKVKNFMHVEKYSHVMHLVSEVEGLIRKGKDVYDCLRATFPAGTVSGSPKVRAMQIIDELENTRRGPYAGCVGYFSFSGNLDTCITIRAILIKNGQAYIQAGGGIVADSNPEKEYQETVNKAKAQLEAITKVG
ncbi:MAG: anthranilate synthase component I [Candidatus Omnitrophica bacterium]|nr:anthranilate synthase component I [Candidatus Omnitrophota bacterium]